MSKQQVITSINRKKTCYAKGTGLYTLASKHPQTVSDLNNSITFYSEHSEVNRFFVVNTLSGEQKSVPKVGTPGEQFCVHYQNTFVWQNRTNQCSVSEHKSVPKVGTPSVHFYVHFQNTKKLECTILPFTSR